MELELKGNIIGVISNDFSESNYSGKVKNVVLKKASDALKMVGLDARGVAEDLEQVGEVVEKLLVGKVLGRAGGGDHWLGGLGVGFRFINADAHCNILSYEHTLK